MNPNLVGKESLLPVQVIVRDNNVDQALRALKKKMQREGIFREMKLRRHFEKPSERKARERAEAVRRMRKVQRKRMEPNQDKVMLELLVMRRYFHFIQLRM